MAEVAFRHDLVGAAIKMPAPAPAAPQQPGSAGGFTFDQPKEPREDLILKAIAIPQGEISLKQRAMLGLIKEDPDLQIKFLERQGFETKLVGDSVQFKNRGGKFVPYNPEGFDPGDIIEYLPEVFEGAVGAVTSGAKVMGAIGAPLTGGASVAAASGLGAAGAGAVELGKQGLAKGLGLREDINLGQVGKQAAIGAAVPPIVGTIGAGLKKVGAGLSKAIFGGVAKQAVDSEGVKAAGKLIGAKPTPGMISGDPAIQATESILSKQTLGIGGSMLRKQIRVNEEAAQSVAESLVASKSGRSAFEVGEVFKDKVVGDIAKKLKPAEKLYGEVSGAIGEIKVNKTALVGKLATLTDKMKFSTEGSNLIKKISSKINKIKSIEDLKLFRTSIRDEIPPTAPKNLKIVADELFAAATQARKESFTQGVRNLKGQFTKEAKQGLLGKLEKADKIYAETASLVQKSLLNQGGKITKGVKRQGLESIEKIIPEKRIDKFFPGLDNAKIQSLKKLSPEGFTELAGAKVAQIVEKATSTAKGNFGKISPKRLAEEIDKLSPEIASEVFGAEGVLKAKALSKFYRAIPKDLNPSGTATTLDILAFPFRQISSASLSALNTFLRTKTPIAKTALFTALSAKSEEK